MKQGCSLSPLLYNTELKALTGTKSQEKEIKRIQIGKEKEKDYPYLQTIWYYTLFFESISELIYLEAFYVIVFSRIARNLGSNLRNTELTWASWEQRKVTEKLIPVNELSCSNRKSYLYQLFFHLKFYIKYCKIWGK